MEFEKELFDIAKCAGAWVHAFIGLPGVFEHWPEFFRLQLIKDHICGYSGYVDIVGSLRQAIETCLVTMPRCDDVFFQQSPDGYTHSCKCQNLISDFLIAGRPPLISFVRLVFRIGLELILKFQA